MTLLSECGLSLTRLAYVFPSVVTDFPLSLLTWSRVGNCKSSFILLCVLCLNLVLPERNILSPWWKKCWMYLEGILVVVLTSGVGSRQHLTTAHWALVLASSTTRHWLALFMVMPIDVSANCVTSPRT